MAAAAVAARSSPARALGGPGKRGLVAAISCDGDPADFLPGLDSALAAITGLGGPDTWRSLFAPGDRVAIKLNCLSGASLSPRPPLVDAVVRGIRSAGVPAGAIVLFDRTSRELERAGYPIARAADAVRCFGTDALRGGGYETEIREHRSIGSLFTRILTEHATVLVNVGVCKDHDLSGVSAACKNLFGLIHNPNRYHANRCDPYLADLLDHPAIAPKLRLNIVDAIDAQCHGGPALAPPYLFKPRKILVSLDPIAIDRIAWEMIEAERAARGMPALRDDGREPTWLATAEGRGLGIADRSRIAVREVAA